MIMRNDVKIPLVTSNRGLVWLSFAGKSRDNIGQVEEEIRRKLLLKGMILTELLYEERPLTN